MKRCRRLGFTLIEILIVIAMIAIIVAITVPGLLRSRYLANESAVKVIIRNYTTAMENYATDHGAIYPNATELIPTYFPYDIDNRTIDGYNFSVAYGNNSYNVTATPLPNAGRYDYRGSVGLKLEWSPTGEGNWQPF